MYFLLKQEVKSRRLVVGVSAANYGLLLLAGCSWSFLITGGNKISFEDEGLPNNHVDVILNRLILPSDRKIRIWSDSAKNHCTKQPSNIVYGLKSIMNTNVLNLGAYPDYTSLNLACNIPCLQLLYGLQFSTVNVHNSNKKSKNILQILITFWNTSLSSMYLKTVMKLVSLSSTSFSVIPFADFFSRLSQYFASCATQCEKNMNVMLYLCVSWFWGSLFVCSTPCQLQWLLSWQPKFCLYYIRFLYSNDIMIFSHFEVSVDKQWIHTSSGALQMDLGSL